MWARIGVCLMGFIVSYYTYDICILHRAAGSVVANGVD